MKIGESRDDLRAREILHPIATRRLLSFWPLVLPLLIWFLPHPGAFPYPSPEAPFSDLTISHYPNALYLREALVEWRTIPLWSPLILSGTPFFADPLSGLHYPPGWLALLFPLPFGFNLTVMAHLLWGGWGMHRLMASEGVGRAGSLLAALGMMCMPKLAAHYGAGHLTLTYAVLWTPWLLWMERARRGSAGSRTGIWRQPGLALGMIALADPRWVAFALPLWWAYGALAEPAEVARNRLTTTLRGLAGQTTLGLLLAAPLWIPLLEYTRGSTRAGLLVREALVFSLPPARLLGLMFPDFGAVQEWMAYPGGIVSILAVVALVLPEARAKSRFWIGAAVLAVFVSLGEHFVPVRWLMSLPGFSVLRVPSRALFVTAIALIVVAARAADRVLFRPRAAVPPPVNLLLAALLGVGATLSLGVRWATGDWALPFVWGAAVTGAVWLWTVATRRAWISRRWAIVLLLALSLADWGAVDRSVLSLRPAGEVLSRREDLARYLAGQPGKFRVYSPSYSLPQHTAARYDLELADGVDPLQLAAYASFMDLATGVPRTGYSVTLPPFASARPATDNAPYRPDAELLGWLNVRFLAADFPLEGAGLELMQEIDGVRLYRNAYVRPRGWVQPAAEGTGDQWQGLRDLKWTPNRVEAIADGPGTLTLSEIDYPGWQVAVDGEVREIQTVVGLLRGVRLEAGEHRVTFDFRPFSLTIGLLAGAVGWGWLALLVFVEKRDRRGGQRD